jgi:hypothetical protein
MIRISGARTNSLSLRLFSLAAARILAWIGSIGSSPSLAESIQRIVKRKDTAKQEASKIKRPDTLWRCGAAWGKKITTT